MMESLVAVGLFDVPPLSDGSAPILSSWESDLKRLFHCVHDSSFVDTHKVSALAIMHTDIRSGNTVRSGRLPAELPRPTHPLVRSLGDDFRGATGETTRFLWDGGVPLEILYRALYPDDSRADLRTWRYALRYRLPASPAQEPRSSGDGTCL